MNHPYLPVLVFLAVAFTVPVASLLMARLFMAWFVPLKPSRDKGALYECGLEPVSGPPARFHPRYYLYGLLFLLFDVETVFLLPFAVAFLGMDAGSFLVAMLFLALLAEGLLWAWLRGFLNWRPARPTPQPAHGR